MLFATTALLRATLRQSASFRFSRIAASGIGALLVAPLLAIPAFANPLGATVTTGSASIAAPSSGKTQIDQKSENVVIDWSSFNIGTGQTTQFVQPNAQAIAVNRIGGANASQIFGTLDANGRLVLINGNGLLFGKNAQVNVGSLIATSTDGTDSDLLAGKFSQAGSQNASVINRGTITTAAHGTVALVAPNVSNTGTVQAKLGTVSLGGANAFTVDFKGDGLVSFATQGDVSGRASVGNTGLLSGATVTMTARAAEGMATGVVDMRGAIEAKAAHNVGGMIVLDAGDGGDSIVAHAKLDASGANGGGAIDIGGWNEGSATVDKSSVLSASAGRAGNGGNISVVANATSFEGRAVAKGGRSSGNGGVIETSGDVVDAQNARIDTLAAHGASGMWSLDPENVTISTAATTNGSISNGVFTPSGDNSVLNAATLEAALSTGNVEVSTGGPGSLGSQPGNITVSAEIAWSNNTLTLDALGAIAIDRQISGTAATLDLIAGGAINQTASGVITAAMLTGSSGGVTGLTAANKITSLGSFTATGGPFELADDRDLTIYGLVNAGVHFVKLTDTGALFESGSGAIDAGALTGSTGGGSILTGANRIATLDAFTTAGSGGFALTDAMTLTVGGAVNVGSGKLTVVTTGSGSNIVIDDGIASTGTIDLASAGAISQNSSGVITAGTLTGSSAGATSLSAANQIANLGAFSNARGNLTFADGQNLIVDGIVNAGAHALAITDTGSLSESGAGAIDAQTLSGSSAGGATLNGANEIAAFESFANSGAGGFSLTENQSITLNGVMTVGTGALTLATMAAGQNIAIATTQSASAFNVTSAGAIAVNAPLTVAGTGSLALNAAGALNINKSITVSGAGSVALDAGVDSTTASGASFLEMTFAPGASLDFGATNEGGSLAIAGQSYALLYSMSDVQNINNNLNANYALATSLNALSVTSWTPIGADSSGNALNSALGFDGTFEGLGHTISNFSINLPGNSSAGLFGASSGTLRDVGMVGGSVTGENASELAGESYETVNCYATGNVTATGTGNYGTAGGLVGNGTFVIDSYASGAVSGYDYVGGLASKVYGSNVAIVNSYATGAVAGTEYVGGLVGSETGVVSNSFATGNVSGTGADVGGLSGVSDNEIGSEFIQSAETINSYATGSVSTSGNYVGGLVGYAEAPIDDSYATGSVTTNDVGSSGTYYVGGLAGLAGTVANSHATGKVQGGFNVGGLVGDGFRVYSSYASGAVHGENFVGGLVGFTDGTVSYSYSTSAINGGSDVGGLAGESFATINYSHATGSVDGFDDVGGLVGDDGGTTGETYATGSVVGSISVGGLIGNNTGSTTNSYAIGAVNGSEYVGGLIGGTSATSVVTASYAIGDVTGTPGATLVGGFIGEWTVGTVQYGYFDVDTSGAIGKEGPGITGLTTAQFQPAPPPGFGSPWGENPNINGGFPFLEPIAP